MAQDRHDILKLADFKIKNEVATPVRFRKRNIIMIKIYPPLKSEPMLEEQLGRQRFVISYIVEII
jgi:hypothetical protein